MDQIVGLVLLNGYYEERLDKVLVVANDVGIKKEDRIKNYEEVLSIASKRYLVVVKRDIDEIQVNLYNPEWIKCCNGNMDIQPCLDYFGKI